MPEPPVARRRDPVLPGQESVWDYPRPPRVEPTARHVRVVFAGETLADTRRALRVLETSHPPVYYLPFADVRRDLLAPSPHRSFCEFKGTARYWDVRAGGRVAEAAAWDYPTPAARYATLRDHVAVYPASMDACFVDGERVSAQASDFYGGWITADVVGPFKGPPGTRGW